MMDSNTSPLREPRLSCGSPASFPQRHLLQFCDFVALHRQVDPRGLQERILQARTLVLAHAQEELVGVIAIKTPSAAYKASLAEKAKASSLAAVEGLEIGWLAVASAHRGAGLARTLTEAAIDCVNGAQLFATAATDNLAPLRLLERNGFQPVGQDYVGPSGRLLRAFIRFNSASAYP